MQFGGMDRSLLSLKSCEEEEISFFATVVHRFLEAGISICVVPPHHKERVNESGIAHVARVIARWCGRKDCVDLLYRTRTIEQLSGGGRRGKMIHYDSIAVNRNICVNGESVLLLDDVTTTGSSLRACRNIIMNDTGAERCAMLALARTVSPGNVLQYEFIKKRAYREFMERAGYDWRKLGVRENACGRE